MKCSRSHSSWWVLWMSHIEHVHVLIPYFVHGMWTMSPMTHATWIKWHIHKKIHCQAMWRGHVAMMLPLGDIFIGAIMFPMHLFVCPKFKLEFQIVLNVTNFYLLFTHWFLFFPYNILFLIMLVDYRWTCWITNQYWFVKWIFIACCHEYKTMTTTKEWSRWHYAKTMDYDYIHDWFCCHTQHVWLDDYVVE